MCDDPTLERNSKKNKTLIRVETEIRFLEMKSTCSTFENNKGVGREGREKEPMLAIDKPEPLLIITLSAAMYDS